MCFKVRKKLQDLGFGDFFSVEDPHGWNKSRIEILDRTMFEKEINDWENRIRSCENGKKLRTYKLFKHSFDIEKYVTCNIAKKYRSAFAKFRCGVAPLRIETGRYENLHVNDRKCVHCIDDIEDEVHVFTKCPLYSELREILYENAVRLNRDFNILNDQEKFTFMFESDDMCSIVAKTCHSILLRRNSFFI